MKLLDAILNALPPAPHQIDPVTVRHYLQAKVDRDTAERVGSGEQPVSDRDRRVTALYIAHFGQMDLGIPQIAGLVECETEDVMQVLGIDHYCSACGRSVDLGQYVTGYTVQGDREYPAFPGTSCCAALHIDRMGKAVWEDPRAWIGEDE